MNLNTITEVKRPSSGGTWLSSEPQVATDTSVDLEALGWTPPERNTQRTRGSLHPVGDRAAPRTVPVADFVTGNQRNILRPAELPRSIHMPASAITKRNAMRKVSLTRLGRSAELIVATVDDDGRSFLLTVAATPHPAQPRFEGSRAISPLLCRGQLSGAVAIGYGSALTENMVHEDGRLVNAQLRNYRSATYADTPHTDIFLADTLDKIVPLGAPSQGKHGSNPVASADANALTDATDVRFADLPFTPDRSFASLVARA